MIFIPELRSEDMQHRQGFDGSLTIGNPFAEM
jgi:hypothetical protein